MPETATVEIAEKEVVAPPETAPVPTRDDLKAQGWSAKEMDAAEKRGMIQKPDEKKEEKKPDAPAAPETKAPAPEKKEEKKENFLDAMDRELTPEQEKVFLDAFGPGTKPRAFYFRAKNERQARQAAQAALEKAQARIRELEIVDPPKPEIDANGNEIDPDDKPLTLRAIKELQKKEAEQAAAQEREISERAQRVVEAQKTQEEFAKSVYPDFDDTARLAAEVIKDLDVLVPEKWKQAKALRLIRDLQISAAQADQIGVDEYNAAMIAYELGSMHPRYGKRAEEKENGKPERPEGKANGGLTAEQMKRMEENAQRRPSSASIPGGGGKRTISVDDVTAEVLVKMSAQERLAFRQKYPDRYAKIVRG